MRKLLYYKIFKQLPGTKTSSDLVNFRYLYDLFEHVVTVDRSGTIITPYNTQNLYPIPNYKKFSKSYEDICNERAKELLNRAEKENKKIFVLYSGGIDSTLVLVSLFTNSTPEQTKLINILMSEESCIEYPKFYKDYLLGKFEIHSSHLFNYILESDNILITGEHNDLIMCGGYITYLMKTFGVDTLKSKYNRTYFLKLFSHIKNNQAKNEFILNIFEKIKNNSPIPIITNMDFLWWINFSLFWQSPIVSYFTFVMDKKFQNKELLTQNFVSFFGTDDFQLWSMNNRDKIVQDTISSYKYICKEIIYKFTGDNEYKINKPKVRSAINILACNPNYHFIDEDFNFLNTINFTEFYNPNNDFRET